MIPSTFMAEEKVNYMQRKIVTLALLALTILTIILCYGILEPFIPIFSWALALTVISYPFHIRMRNLIKNENIAAFLSTAAVVLLILVPTVLVLRQVIEESAGSIGAVSGALQEENYQRFLNRHSNIQWLERNLGLRNVLAKRLEAVQAFIPGILASSFSSLAGLLLVFFTIFFFLRDRRQVLSKFKELIPLSKRESSELISRISDTIYATLYGTLLMAFLQGFLGGMIFWFLALPAPFLWGSVMGIFALVPYLGAFVIWAPAALWLAMKGMWWQASVLTAWGALIIGLIDNLLYPMLVGKKLRLHTLPVFFFILGGVMFFGASGIVLGPLTLAIADALLDFWKRRLEMPSSKKDTVEEVTI